MQVSAEVREEDRKLKPRSPEDSGLLVLRNASDVEALLSRSRALLHPLGLSRVRLVMNALPGEDARILEGRIQGCLRECGCDTGSLWAVAGILGYVALLPFMAGGPARWGLRHIGWGFAVCIGFALCGKLFGLLRARIRLVRHLEDLLRHLQQGSAAGG